MQNKMIAGISAAAMAAGLGFGLSQVATADTTPSPTPSATLPTWPLRVGWSREWQGWVLLWYLSSNPYPFTEMIPC